MNIHYQDTSLAALVTKYKVSCNLKLGCSQRRFPLHNFGGLQSQELQTVLVACNTNISSWKCKAKEEELNEQQTLTNKNYVETSCA